MTTKHDKNLAYAAGRAASAGAPEHRTPDACPFPTATEERSEWLRGFAEAVDEEPDRPTLRKELNDAMKLNDSAGGKG